MNRPPSDTLFSILLKDFPSLGEHTIRSIIHYSQKDYNISYDACRKMVAGKSLPQVHLAGGSGGAIVPGGDSMPRRSPVRTRSDAAFDMAELGDCPPDWSSSSDSGTPGAGSCSAEPGGYSGHFPGLAASPRQQANGGSMLSYSHGQTLSTSSGAGDYLPDHRHLLLGLHRHSEPDVLGSMHASAGSSRPSAQRMPGSYTGASSAHQDPSLRGSPPVNGQLHIVTGEDGDMDDSWAQVVVGDTDVPQMQPYLSPLTPQLLQYPNEVNMRRTPNGSRTSAEFLEKILVQQRKRLEKLAQATAALDKLHLDLQAEEARLTDEIMSTKKQKQAYGLLGSSTEQELTELKLEKSRLMEEARLLQMQCSALSATRAPAAQSSRVQQGRALGSSPPVTSLGSTYTPPPGYTARPNLFSASAQQLPTPGRGQQATALPPRLTVPPRLDVSTGSSPSAQPPRLFGVQQQRYPPVPVQQQQHPVPQPTPSAQWSAQPRPPRPPPHSDEGEQWSCSACTFLNHPTLSMCEMCDTPRM